MNKQNHKFTGVFTLLINNISEAAVVLSPDALIQWYNSASADYMIAFFGKKAEIDESFYNFVHKEDFDSVKNNIQTAFEGLTIIAKKEVNLTHGEKAILEVKYIPYINENKVEYVLLLSKDISLNKKSKQEINNILVDYESQLNILSKSLNTGIFFTEKGVFKRVNPSFLNIFGYNNESDLIGEYAWQLAVPEERDFIKKEMYMKLKELDYSPIEVECEKQSGEKIWVELRYTRIDEEKGIIGLATDITERKENEFSLSEMNTEIMAQNEEYQAINEELSDTVDQLQMSENKFKLVFENTTVGFVVAKPDTTFEDINPAFANMLGYDVGELMKLTFRDFTHPDDLTIELPLLQKLLNKEISNYSIIKRYIKRTGELIWVRLNVGVLWTSTGDLKYLIALAEDITEQQNATIKIAKARDLYLKILNEFPVPVWRTNARGDVDYYNLTWLNNRNATLKDEFNTDWKDKIHPEDFDLFEKTFNDSFAKREPYKLRYRLKNGTNDYRWMDEVAMPFFDENSKFIGYIGACFDIHYTIESKQELMKAKEKAEESDRLKSAFLANMSHEIRTPLNAILGFTDILAKKELEKSKQDKFLKLIHSRGKDLLEIINDIIDISKIEAGQVALKEDEYSLNIIVKELYAFYNSDIKNKEKDILLKYSMQLPGEDSFVLIDRAKITAVLTNLLANAIKFTAKGSIHFGYYIKDEEIIFYVKDTGIGIPPEFMKNIFKRFSQVDNSETRSFGGTGLGLAISKGLVEIMSGEIGVNSESGEGACFWFKIPYNYVENKKRKILYQDKVKDLTDFNWNGKSILVVEDDDSSFYLIDNIVSEFGAKVTRAINGNEAVTLAGKSNFNLILMDIELPESNGYEATKTIRQINYAIPIIAQTAFAFENDRIKCFKAGCNDYITKPIDSIKLLNKIDLYLNTK